MLPPNGSSRREFVLGAGAASAALYAAVETTAHQATEKSAEKAAEKADPDSVLAKLIEGNKRFATGKTSLLSRRSPKDFIPLAEGQKPSAIIVACADSRVAPELIFDQGIGDLFVVRVAGNLVSGSGPIVKGSIEFAVAELGARLILVLGHSQCGAIKGAIGHVEAGDVLPGAINELVKLIRPAVVTAKGQPGDQLNNVIKANVLRCVETLKGMGPIVSKFVKSKELKVVGGTYELRTGLVEIFS